MEGKSRPILVGLIGLVTLLAAVLILAVSVLSLVSPDVLTDFVGTDITDMVGYTGLIIGLITLIIGIAIWRGWTIAWYIAVILYAISVLGSIISLIMLFTDEAASTTAASSFILPLAIGLLILYYLFRPKVKEFFGV